MHRMLLAVVLALTAGAAYGELPTTIKADQTTLVLNGAGTRTKYLMSMYEAGLYLGSKTSDAAAIVEANEPMAIRLEIVSGMVSQEKLVDALNEGFAAATARDPAALRGEIEQFRKCFAAPITKGDKFDLAYFPGRGVIVLKNGKRQGAIPGLAFKQALFSIWLGKAPADDDLKAAMLGK